MHLAAGQCYQQTWPLSAVPPVRPISDSSVYKRASAGRAPILKFHSGRREGERGREAKRDGRIAEQAIYSNRWFIRAFKRWRSKFSAHLRLIFALILDDFVRGVPDTRSIVRFNGLFFHRPWIYYGKLEESVMGRVRGCLEKYIDVYTRWIQLKENISYVFVLPRT